MEHSLTYAFPTMKWATTTLFPLGGLELAYDRAGVTLAVAVVLVTEAVEVPLRPRDVVAEDVEVADVVVETVTLVLADEEDVGPLGVDEVWLAVVDDGAKQLPISSAPS
jgi:hypothetical protein